MRHAVIASTLLLLSTASGCGEEPASVAAGIPIEQPRVAEPPTAAGPTPASRIPVGTIEELQRLIPSVDEAAMHVEDEARALAQIELATWCGPGVSPATARYVTYNPGMAEVMVGDSCFLPWARSRALQPESSEEGWIDLNLAQITCGESGPLEISRAVRQPTTLYVRLPEGATAATVRARMMRGEPREGDFHREGFEPWRPIRDGQIPSGRVLTLPLADIVGDANHWVQFEVVLDDGSARKVDLLWPFSC
jgi:hypothetical protein